MLSVHVADLWKHPAGKALRDKLTEGMPDALKAVRGHLGVGPEEIDRVTAFMPLPSPGTRPPLVAVTTLKPYDQKAVLAAAAPDAKEQKVMERSYYLNDRGPSLAFLDDRTFVMAQPEQLEAYLKQAGDKTEGPLTPVLRLAEKHCAVAGLDVAAVRRSPPPFPDKLPPELAPFKPLFKAQLVTLTADLGDQLKADLRVTFATEADAADGAAAVDDGLHMVRGGLVRMMKDLNRFELRSESDGPTRGRSGGVAGGQGRAEGEYGGSRGRGGGRSRDDAGRAGGGNREGAEGGQADSDEQRPEAAGAVRA